MNDTLGFLQQQSRARELRRRRQHTYLFNATFRLGFHASHFRLWHSDAKITRVLARRECGIGERLP